MHVNRFATTKPVFRQMVLAFVDQEIRYYLTRPDPMKALRTAHKTLVESLMDDQSQDYLTRLQVLESLIGQYEQV